MKRAVLVLLAACHSENPENLTAISVLKFDSGDGCFFRMTPEAPDPALQGVNECPNDSGVPPTLTAGVDHVEMVIDYGADVHFSDIASTSVPAPIISVSVDGVASLTPIVPIGPLPGPDHRAFFFGDFTAPTTPTTNLALTVTVAPGYAEVVPTTFTVSPAMPAITIAECPATGTCTLIAGVGVATAQVTVPGTVPQTINFRTYVNNVPQDQQSAPVQTALDGDKTSAIVSFPTPDSGANSAWRIDAILGASTAPSPVIHLTQPTITASLGCATPCTLAAGSVVNLTVTAPEGIHQTQAVTTARLDGVPTLSELDIDLSDVDHTAHTISGALQLQAPDSPGTWTLDVSVDGYRAQTVVATID
ncbi:MAG TPA: hypothetical protein VGM88_00955 [Kofleriaceae bacterium]